MGLCDGMVAAIWSLVVGYWLAVASPTLVRGIGLGGGSLAHRAGVGSDHARSGTDRFAAKRVAWDVRLHTAGLSESSASYPNRLQYLRTSVSICGDKQSLVVSVSIGV